MFFCNFDFLYFISYYFFLKNEKRGLVNGVGFFIFIVVRNGELSNYICGFWVSVNVKIRIVDIWG